VHREAVDQQEVDEAFEELGARLRRAAQLVEVDQHLVEGVERRGEHGLEQLFLRGVVVEHARLADPGPLGDALDRGAVVAGGREFAEGDAAQVGRGRLHASTVFDRSVRT
jgi:hypothetical protein